MPEPPSDSPASGAQFLSRGHALNPASERFAVEFVEALLSEAQAAAVSDVHIQPRSSDGSFDVLWRLNGVLQHVGTFPQGKENVVGRLKVLAQLLTYKTDVPQEGRIRLGDEDIEMRLSVFPTVHGEKGVVRLFIASGLFRTLEQLGLPEDIEASVGRTLAATSGVFLTAGPAGSGKTTTLYACLRHIQTASPQMRSIASLEDPVEAIIPGIAQSQIRPSAGFTYASGLRSILRQDPEVIMVGEIRDHEAAETAFQASLTGHLVLTSFHAGSSAEAISRLSDMGIEPYVLRSGLRAILMQRLVRRLCNCAVASDTDDMAGDLADGRQPRGCPECRQTGYRGRMLIAEFVNPAEAHLRQAILNQSDASEIEARLVKAGVCMMHERAELAMQAGLTSADEVRRALGISE